jgi:sec-independent protein translocase protein TatA
MLTTILLGMLGTTEIVLIVIVVLLLFGGKKIPELMKGLGKGISEFKKAKEGIAEETQELAKKD